VNFAIVKSHPDLLNYVESLQAKNSDSLGFLPNRVFELRSEAGQLFLGLLNGEPAGYIVAGTGFQGTMRCHQVCIEYDVRRRLYGAMLIAAVEQYGETLGCSRISLRCGSDLPANGFWQSLAYRLVATEESGIVRRHRRHINVWGKALHPSVIATTWKNGRPRVYPVGLDRERAAARQRACRETADRHRNLAERDTRPAKAARTLFDDPSGFLTKCLLF
jgi:GNAT superfamily N-acetyltransferase